MEQQIGSARSLAPKRPRSFNLDAPPPAAIAKQLRSSLMMDDRLMLLLFETPCGFAIFNFVAEVIEKPNALEEIWTRFILIGTAKSLDQPIILTSYSLFECDALEEEKSEELDFLADVIKMVSGIDTEGWGSLKIATALKKIWCPEEADNSCEIISEDEVSRLVNHADKYKVKLVKDACLTLSRQITKAHSVRTSKKKLLIKYAEQAKKAYEARKLMNHELTAAESVSAN